MSDLPEGWIWATLADVARWGSGGTPKATEARFYGGEIPWAVIGDLTDSRVHSTKASITHIGLKESSAKIVPTGAVLVAMYGSIGKLGIVGIPMATNQAIAFAQPVDGLLTAGYLFWYLRHQRSALRRAGKGATQQNISQTVLKAWPIPVPPVAEQERIVAAIERHLSHYDAGVDALRRVELNLHRMRVAVLDAAISGHLVEARGACESVPLGDLLAERLRNGHSAKRSTQNKGVRTLTLTAVTKGDFSEVNTKLTIADPGSIEDLWLRPGDVLIERSNTPELVGTGRMYRGPERWSIFPDLLIRARIAPPNLPEYIEVVLLAEKTRRYFRSSAQGIAGSMPKIDQGVVERMLVPLPPPDVQSQIVSEVERQMTILDSLVGAIGRAKRRGDALQEAVLSSAFSGCLVPRDPSSEPLPALVESFSADPPTNATDEFGRFTT